jgi:nucleoside-diphosphate-sugar epimerase
MMKVLITGINGRIGKYVAKELLQNGIDVIGLDIGNTINSELQSCSYIKADITDRINLKSALSGYKVESVIHLAALAHFSSSNIPLEKFMKINYEGSLNVAEVSYKCGAKKMLFSSTVDVYGETKDKIVNEDTVCNPVTNYGKSKYEAEKKLREYLSSVGIEYYVFRFTPVYLPEDTKDLDKRVLLPKRLGAFYFKDGSYKFSLCSIFNIVNAIIYFTKSNLEPGIYIVSDQKVFTAKEIAEIKKKNGEVKRVIYIPHGLIYVGIKIISRVLESFGRIEKGLLLNKLNKLTSPVFYDSSKIAKKVKLNWNVKNTLNDDN